MKKINNFLVLAILLCGCTNIGIKKTVNISGNEQTYYINTNSFIDNELVYNVNSSGILKVADLNGGLKWKLNLKKYTKENFKNGVLISFDKDSLYVTSPISNKIIKISKERKDISWIKEINSIPDSKIVFDEKNLYFITNTNNLYSMNKASSKIDWIHSTVANSTYLSGSIKPLFYNVQSIIAPYNTGEVFLVSKSDGKTLWDIDLTEGNKQDFINITNLTDVKSQPIIIKNILYIANNNNGLFAVNLDDGKILWKKPIKTYVDLVIENEILYIVDDMNEVNAINIKSQKILWTLKLDKFKKKKIIVYNKPCLLEDKIILTNNFGEIITINKQNGELISINDTNKKFNKNLIIMNDKLILPIK